VVTRFPYRQRPHNSINYTGFLVIASVTIKSAVLWVTTPCSLATTEVSAEHISSLFRSKNKHYTKLTDSHTIIRTEILSPICHLLRSSQTASAGFLSYSSVMNIEPVCYSESLGCLRGTRRSNQAKRIPFPTSRFMIKWLALFTHVQSFPVFGVNMTASVV
jgi:hypothetical protein